MRHQTVIYFDPESGEMRGSTRQESPVIDSEAARRIAHHVLEKMREQEEGKEHADTL